MDRSGGLPWRLLPNDFPFWEAVYQQSRRWLDAGCFEAIVMDLRSMIRFASGRRGQPSAVVLDGRTLQSSCESGPRSSYDSYKHKRGSKVHMAVDTLGHLLAVHVTPANEQERAQVFELCKAVQTVTGHTVELAWADHGYTGEQPKRDAQAHGIELQVIKLAEAKKGFVLLPKRWVVERSFAWGSTLPAPGQGLRAAARCPARTALPGLRHPHAAQGKSTADGHGKFITRSREPPRPAMELPNTRSLSLFTTMWRVLPSIFSLVLAGLVWCMPVIAHEVAEQGKTLRAH
jgi:transposase